jgi:hypothetical protein
MPAPKGGNKGSFKKGYKGGGRKALSSDVLAAQAASKEQFINWVVEISTQYISDYGNSKESIAKALNELPLGKRIVAKWFIEADTRGVEYCHNRIWGRIPEPVQLSTTKDNKLEIVITEK